MLEYHLQKPSYACVCAAIAAAYKLWNFSETFVITWSIYLSQTSDNWVIKINITFLAVLSIFSATSHVSCAANLFFFSVWIVCFLGYTVNHLLRDVFSFPLHRWLFELSFSPKTKDDRFVILQPATSWLWKVAHFKKPECTFYLTQRKHFAPCVSLTRKWQGTFFFWFSGYLLQVHFGVHLIFSGQKLSRSSHKHG